MSKSHIDKDKAKKLESQQPPRKLCARHVTSTAQAAIALSLNDAEYDLYTSCLHDLIDCDDDGKTPHDDSYYERISVGVREARAWLRGRYPELSAGDLDSILRLFHPNLNPGDTLAGGQFFAVLRLVTHVRSGKSVERSLVFVQAYPQSQASRSHSPLQRHRSSPYPSQSPSPLRCASDASPPPEPPLPSPEYIRRKSSESQARPPPQHPDTRPPPPPANREPPPVPLKPSNPFLSRRLKKSSGGGAEDPAPQKVPPLPPRKPPPLLPPRHSSLVVSPTGSASASTSTTSTAHGAGASSANRVPHAVTPLMRQSLEASKVGQTVRAMEDRLGKERILEVVKSSSGSGSGGSTRSRSFSPGTRLDPRHNDTASPGTSSASSSSGTDTKSAPALPTRHRRASPPSSAGSMRSFEQVAHASVNPFGPATVAARAYSKSQPQHRSPSASPSRPRSPEPPVSNLAAPSKPKSPPPTHPDRKPPLASVFDPSSPPDSPTAGSTARVGRSKSMHHPAPPPVPPPRRRRPESVQLPGSVDLTEPISSSKPDSYSYSASSYTASGAPAFHTLSRHLSLSSSRDRSANAGAADPIANLQRTLSNLHTRAQPKLDAARYKAEAGLSKRGFVSHAHFNPAHWREEGEEALMADSGSGEGFDPDVDQALDSASDSVEDDRDRDRARVRHAYAERDNLKWPAGDGWAPL
ncbi:hypothetical protein GLOTRDRAFT_139912 [Gloeophyllum trabeum ATCC 11539]|uniref:Uncharacterized protein n=1 Tax=Gloeophyllum trabeum (strain ATCC 11539 / FP-39264 / Madison 617) TaxID=670483 RepID=S7Q1L0_GLOTA|nr:uncharacterized protein GLOTRDRAFT_139912 [Gloeophyllum trabeum ATCC 11539]EPQ53861.1 hypothetical protein GLOTRDRAFT_139912 [Gloeophyllum trabeum ATCC 11539]